MGVLKHPKYPPKYAPVIQVPIMLQDWKSMYTIINPRHEGLR